ncbi:MAG: hypothetical protein AMXMBFR53_41930 [Gemmatimonadota bacterium]
MVKDSRGQLVRERLEAVSKMKRLSSGTSMTSAQRREFDEAHDRVRALDARLASGDFGPDVVAGRQDVGVWDDASDDYRGAKPAARALRPDESVRSFVEERGLGGSGSEAAREIGVGRVLRALLMGPRDDAERRALSEGSDSAGGYSVPIALGAELIDRMRPQAHVLAAGARLVPLESDQHVFAKVTGDPTPSWRGEGGSVSEQAVTFGALRFAPRSVAFVVKASRELIQDAANLEEELPRLFTRVMAGELDRVCLYGDGASEPLGMRHASGISEYSMGTNGAVPSNYDALARIRRLILEANAPAPTTAIWSPRTDEQFGLLRDGEGLPLLRPPSITDWTFRATAQVSNAETQGSASDASTIFVGGFRELWIGSRLDVRVEVLRERYADTLQTGFLVYARWDTGYPRPAALGRVIGFIG